jgi:amino acid adenylation domain-containing protein
LLDRIARVAGALAERGLGRGSRVGICLGRSRDLPIAMLAALSTGAAYVPLDPSYPRQRLAAMIADASPDIVIADRSSAAALPGGVPLLLTDSLAQTGAAFSPVAARPDDLAYVIHTSGSTGRPAGVEVERGALANFLAAMRAELPLSSADTILAITPYSFDIAALELLLPLTIGARVAIAEVAVARDGRLLAERIERGDVTILQATPATWRMLIDAGWKGSRRLTALCGGEALPAALAAEIVGRVGTLFNLYGPTETTIWSTFAQIMDANRTVPIGRPLANTTCLVVDDALRPVGPGVAGELLIGGAGLARGYRNDPVRTAERFISDPLDPGGRRKVFRTGDFVRRHADGSLQFLGRRDSQVKVRGFRIELGEVEAQLRSHSSVRDVAVVAVGDDLLDRRLAAFAVIDPDVPSEAGGLTAHLRERLPYYMVPDIVRVVAAIPRLPNGKSDRGRLTALAQVPVLQGAEERPRTPVEMQLAAVLEELLGLDQVGLDDNFFSLGGTSLLGMRYVTRVNDVYHVRLGAADMVRAPTVASMAQLVADQLTRAATAGMYDPEVRADALIGAKLWRPLAMSRAEGSFDEIDAAAIAYLPDDLLELARRTGTERALRRQLPAADDPQWSAVCHLPAGTIALVVVPRFGIDLIADRESTVRAVDAATHYALRLGAKTVALTGLIPAMTDLGRALASRQGLTITTGHATTASAVVMTVAAAARAGGRVVADETIAFVGLGAIGSATLRLMLDRKIIPRSLILCDVPAKRAELERLAEEARPAFATRGDVEIVCASDRLADEVYGSRFIVGATNSPGLLDIERLRPGTIVVDDSSPYCFDLAHAIRRMSVRGDVLLVDGGFVSPRGTLQWQMTLPANAAVLGDHAEAAFLPDSRAITGCILSSLLLQAAGAPATIGPVDVATCRNHWLALERMGIGAAPLRCRSWSPSASYLEMFRTQFGRAGG